MGRTWGTRSRNMSLEGRISDEVVRELKRRRQPVQMVTDWNDIWVTHTSFKSIVKGLPGRRCGPAGDGAALVY
jgi:gamma-glutamyltranspeptidase/glutathione hydrolase